jgi:hypothetical protein
MSSSESVAGAPTTTTSDPPSPSLSSIVSFSGFQADPAFMQNLTSSTAHNIILQYFKDFVSMYVSKFKIIMMVILTVVDTTTDVLTLKVYHNQNDIGWFGFGLSFLVVAQIIVGIMLARSQAKQRRRSRKKSSTLYNCIYFILGFAGLAPFIMADNLLRNNDQDEEEEEIDEERQTHEGLEEIKKMKLVETLTESFPQVTLQVYVFGIMQTSKHHLVGQDLWIATLSIIVSVFSVLVGIQGQEEGSTYNKGKHKIIISILESIFFVGWLGRWAVFGASYGPWVLILLAFELLLLNITNIIITTIENKHCPKFVNVGNLLGHIVMNFSSIFICMESKTRRIMTICDSIIITGIMYALTLPKTGMIIQRVHLCEDRVGCFSHTFIWIVMGMMGVYALVVGIWSITSPHTLPGKISLKPLIKSRIPVNINTEEKEFNQE